jgi:uncharacterized membrane protein YjgN (DUF898 family)
LNDATLRVIPAGRSDRIAFTGERRDFFRLVRRGVLLEAITAGFYRFWLTTDMRRALWSGTSVAGHALEYTGTAKELLLGFLFALAILAPIYLVYFLIGIELRRVKAFASVPLFLFFYAFGQFAVFRARRYRTTRTVWRGVRFWMSGSGWAYASRACLWDLLTSLTLGLALPWRESALERYKLRHLHYGDLPACFEGTGWELFKRGWGLWLLSLPIVTLPFTYLALQAVIWQWWLCGIRFGEVRFESNLRTGALMGLYGAVVGWMILIAFVNVVAMAIGQFVVVIAVHLIGGPGSATLVPPHAVFSNWVTIGLLVANFVVLALCASIVVRIYLVRELWERVVMSTTIHNLDRADNVRGRGAPASALGEGLADALDVAGF